jgi:hypothetical protein
MPLLLALCPPCSTLFSLAAPPPFHKHLLVFTKHVCISDSVQMFLTFAPSSSLTLKPGMFQGPVQP